MDKKKLEQAYKCIDALANGLDPETGADLSTDSVVNKASVVRSLFYARTAIEEMARAIQRKEQMSSTEQSPAPPTAPPIKPHERMLSPKEPHPQMQLDAENPEMPIEEGKQPNMRLYTGLKFSTEKKIKEFWSLVAGLGDPALKDVGYADVTAWLCDRGYLQKSVGSSRQSKRPTEKGLTIGIYERQSTKGNGKFAAEVLYSPKAQAFIVEHLPDICKHHKSNRISKS